MSTPLVDPVTGEPVVSEDGKPLVCNTGDCTCPPLPPCDCSNPETAEVGEWDNTDEFPCNIGDCIVEQHIWLFQVELDWRDEEGTCHIVDGAFILTPDETDSMDYRIRHAPPLRPGWHAGGFGCCGSTWDETAFNVSGACQVECPTLSVGFSCTEVLGEASILWSAALNDRIFFAPICNDILWWRATGTTTLVSTITPGMSFPLYDDCGAFEEGDCSIEVISASVTLLGKVCGGDLDGDGEPDDGGIDEQCPINCAATALFSIEETDVDCQFAVTNLSTPGECPIKLYVWSDGYVSEEPERPLLVVFGGCGHRDGGNITLWTIDENDCVSESTLPIPGCCKCSDADGEPCYTGGGSLSVEEIEPCEFELCATISVNGEGEAETVCGDFRIPFIEWYLTTTGCNPVPPECDCEDIGTEDCMALACGRTLLNGNCSTVILESSAILRWRTWDSSCGCVSEWNEQLLECTECLCCDGSIVSVTVDVAGYTEGDNGPDYDCADCTGVNRTFEMRPTGGGGGCLWWWTSVEYEPEGVIFCIDDSNPEYTYAFGLEVFFGIYCDSYPTGNVTIFGYVNAVGQTEYGPLSIGTLDDPVGPCEIEDVSIPISLVGDDFYCEGALSTFTVTVVFA